MKILVIGCGGVGDAVARIAARHSFFDAMIMADREEDRPQRTVDAVNDPRFSTAIVDASSAESVEELVRKTGATHVLNAVDPRFVMPIFNGVKAAGANYLDMAMSLSGPNKPLGEDQFAQDKEWEKDGQLALVGIGVEPGLSNIFARYAQDHLFSDIEELGTRDGSNLVVKDEDGNEIFAPSFSIWTTIEECLNPPVIWEKDRGWYTTEPFFEPEMFDFPEGIGPVECVHVEHEEVLMMPRWLKAKKATFKYGLGAEFINVLRTLHQLGLDSTKPLKVRSADGPVQVSPRDVVAAALPDPATIGPRMEGKTCAGVYVTGTGKDGKPRAVYLYHVVDNQWTMKEFGAQCVVWQTAINPVVALQLLAEGAWEGSGVRGPETFNSVPFLDLLKGEYDSPWGMEEREPVT